jgi:6-phosphogluconolactonase
MEVSRSPGNTAAVPLVRRFETHADASAALADEVAATLHDAANRRGNASLAVPGGTTPGEFLGALGAKPLAWPRVTVLLTDERWVAPDHPRSNTALVDRTLGAHGRTYRWYPLWREGVSLREAVALLEADAGAVPWPLDVAVLGMGDDGHVASLFPCDEAGFADPNSRFVAVRGPGDEPRVSLSAAVLEQACEVYVLLRGAAKLSVLQRALGGELPIARLFAARDGRVHVFASE